MDTTLNKYRKYTDFVWRSTHILLKASITNSNESNGNSSGSGKGLAFANLVIQ